MNLMNGTSLINHPSGPAGGETEPSARSLAVGKWGAGLFSCLLIGAVLSPVIQNWRAKPVDSFPFSYYPMFSEKREGTSRVTYMVGIDSKGNRHNLHYKYARGDMGAGGLNQVRRQISKMLERKEADKLCQAIARNVSNKQEGWLAKVVAVEVRTDTYNLNDYFTGKSRIPVKSKIHATCSVKRDGK
jgi:hypothetical protein